MQYQEQALSFSCGAERLVGIASVPEQPGRRGVLIVVGGPQYRAGSHRQFTLLARALAERGIPVLRFDYRGMGDSEGDARNFEQVEQDLRTAIDQFYAAVPALVDVVIWGLCDGASAALFYAQHDARVSGLVLLNPWVRTVSGEAKATLKHYYRARLTSPELWKKIGSGQFNFLAAGAAFLRLCRTVLRPQPRDAGVASTALASATLPERMRAGLERYSGRVLLILSGADLTAQEFSDTVQASSQWRVLLDSPRVTQRRLEEADHTFSRRVWHDQVVDWTGDWLAL